MIYMKNQAKLIAVFASLALLTGCGAFNTPAQTADSSAAQSSSESSEQPQSSAESAAENSAESESAADTAAPEKSDFNLGYLNSTAHLLAFVAQEEGYFKDEGLNVTLTQFSSAGELVNGLESGKLDLA